MRYISLFLALCLLLCACTAKQPEITPTEVPTTEATTQPTTVPTEPAPTEPEPTLPAHSPLYLPEYTQQEVLQYFEEVVLRMEYADGTGDVTRVQKWIAPLRYHICGTPTAEDLAILADLFAQLNEIPGFPGIYAEEDGVPGNLTIHFLARDGFDDLFLTFLNGEQANGATQFWYYTDSNEIHTANVGYRSDIDQSSRNSILLEEIVNTLGISDSELRTDSIVYQYSDENTVLSDMDWLILKLLYDPAIQCGMDFDQCRAIIEALYY